MQMEAFLWLFLPVFVAGGSALLSYYVMQARMEVALAKERESLAEARAQITSHKITLEERIKATEEACKRQALDGFMQDIRVEERSYVRETKSANASRKTMVMQERIFFRNIPLSNWIEREMLVEDGQDSRVLTAGPQFAEPRFAEPRLAEPRLAEPWFAEPGYTPPALAKPETPAAITKLLQEVKSAPVKVTPLPTKPPLPASSQKVDLLQTIHPVLLTQHATAFGAQ